MLRAAHNNPPPVDKPYIGLESGLTVFKNRQFELAAIAGHALRRDRQNTAPRQRRAAGLPHGQALLGFIDKAVRGVAKGGLQLLYLASKAGVHAALAVRRQNGGDGYIKLRRLGDRRHHHHEQPRHKERPGDYRRIFKFRRFHYTIILFHVNAASP